MNDVAKPGVMIYFDILEQLDLLTNEQIGKLFLAILKYASTGEDQEDILADDLLLKMAWTIVKKDVERDDKTYKEKSLRSKFGAYCRWEKESGRTPLDYDTWYANEYEHDANSCHSNANSCNSNANECEHDAKNANYQLSTINNQQSTINCQQPTINNQLSNNSNTRKQSTQKNSVKAQYELEFEYLWNLYPNKKGKQKAKIYYIKAREKGVSKEEVEAGIKNYINWITLEHKENYIKDGSTWFYNSCWEDDYSVKRQPTLKDIAPGVDLTDFGVKKWTEPNF